MLKSIQRGRDRREPLPRIPIHQQLEVGRNAVVLIPQREQGALRIGLERLSALDGIAIDPPGN
jgi:hypothetical protein